MTPDILQRLQRPRGQRRHYVSAAECIEMGRALAELKHSAEHGDFGSRLHELGVDDSHARRLMKTFRAFGAPGLKRVVSAAGSQSKLFELLVLDESDLRELERGGEVYGLTTGLIKHMSARALREAVRIVDVRDPVIVTDEAQAQEQRLLTLFRSCDASARAHIVQAAELLSR